MIEALFEKGEQLLVIVLGVEVLRQNVSVNLRAPPQLVFVQNCACHFLLRSPIGAMLCALKLRN